MGRDEEAADRGVSGAERDREGPSLPAALLRIEELERQARRDRHYLELARKLLELTGEAIFHTDAQLKVIRGNPAFLRLVEASAEEIAGRDLRELLADESGTFPHAALEALRESGTWEGEIRRSGPLGEPRNERVVLSAVPGEEGRVEAHIGLVRDLSELKKARAVLEYSASHDSLTGLPNRDYFNAALQELIQRPELQSGVVAVCVLDLDDFKRVNNDLSREAGDLLLKAVAGRLAEALRAGDLLARSGGDEFSLALPLRTREELEPLAARLLRLFDEPFAVMKRNIYVSATMGVSLCPDHGDEASALSGCADMALQSRKHGSKRNYELYHDDLGEWLHGQASLSSELHSALEARDLPGLSPAGHISVQYQPLVEIGSGLVVGTEALARWNHPDRGLVPPSRFIPLAEESSLIVELGSQVLKTACAQARAWLACLPRPPRVCVNVSVRQLQDAAFVEEVRRGVAGLPHGLVTLEITESQLFEDLDDAATILASLKETGVHLSVDDFGTGYASLSYLRKLPLDTVKIDQSFVKELVRNRQDRRIVEVVASLAREIGARTVAEGVESKAQLEILHDIGCDFAQGFLFSPAVDAEEIITMSDGAFDATGAFIGGAPRRGMGLGQAPRPRDRALSESPSTTKLWGGRGLKRR